MKDCETSHARRRLAADSTPSHNMEVSMLQQVAPRQENYTQSRAVALQNVESTISELGGIFTQLATMVAQQGELAIRFSSTPIYFIYLHLFVHLATQKLSIKWFPCFGTIMLKKMHCFKTSFLHVIYL